MAEKRSYHIKQFSTDVQGEVERLRAQVDLFWDKEIRCYKQFGLEDGMSVLECGSGPGYVTEKILSEFPNCRATAIEIDPFLIDILKSVAEEKKIKVSQQSVTHLGFKDNTFDFVITRLVLEHLPEPELAVREIFRVLKTGGIAVFVDNDFEMHLKTFPGIPEINTLYEAYCASRSHDGGNPKIGRQLPNIMESCGFTRVDLEIICAHNRLVGDDMFLKSEGVGIPAKLVKDGYLDARILDRLAVRWRQVLKNEDHAIYRQLFVAGGVKTERSEEDAYSSKPRSKTLIDRPACDVMSLPIKGATWASKSREEQVEVIRRILAGVLGCDENEINVDTRFIDTGLDSLMAVEVIGIIETETGILLSLMDFFEGQTLADLGDKMASKRLGDSEARSGSSPGTGGDSGGLISEADPVEWEEGEV